MKFNINNYVQIKLTEKGKQVLNEKIDNDLAILNRYGINTSTYDRSEPQDGYWKFQLWEVMQIFGPYMKQGLENVIEMDIVLEELPKTITVMGIDGGKWFAKEIPVEDFEKLQKSVVEENSLHPESLKLLKEEVQKARKKFPGAEDLTVALMEEAGELAQATLKCDSENIKKEALQVACVAMRIFEEGDSTFTKRVGITQDEKYEYEKWFTRQDITFLDCGYDDSFYWFKIKCEYTGFSTLKTKTKPSKRSLFDVAQGACKKGWLIEDNAGNIRFNGLVGFDDLNKGDDIIHFVGISQDDESQYEEELLGISRKLVSCGYDKGEYWFKILNLRQYKGENNENRLNKYDYDYVVKTKKKPLKNELARSIEWGEIQKDWIILDNKGRRAR